MQIVIEGFFDKIIDECAYCRSLWTNALGSEFGLRLRLEDGLLHLDGHRTDNRRPDIGCIEIFFVKLTYGLYQCLPKCRLVRTSLRSMLPIYKGVIFLAILLSMGHGNFDIFPLKMNNRIAHGLRVDVAFE